MHTIDIIFLQDLSMTGNFGKTNNLHWESVNYDSNSTKRIETNLSYHFQYGVRSSYLTDLCLIHLFDHIK